VFLENLITSNQVVEKFSAFYGTRIVSVYVHVGRTLVDQNRFKVLDLLKLSVNYKLRKGGKYFDHLKAYHFLKKDSVFWILFQTYHALGKSEFVYV
jgi:hypothetical protein